MVTLETDRLILRSFRIDDAKDFFEYAKDEEVGPSAGWAPHQDKSESLRIIKMFMKQDEVWAIELKRNRKVIGSFGFHPDSKRDKGLAYMIGYVLSKDYWGQGLMTEAVSIVLKYAFLERKVPMISVYHFPFNVRSKRVIEKHHFRYEGILRNATLLYNGVVYDDYCYSLTREEYLTINNYKG